jgi:methylated-DNA-[protein]-cysteine S-methyltransferase
MDFLLRETPIGRLRLGADDHAVCEILWAADDARAEVPTARGRSDAAELLARAAAEIDAYFAGALMRFTVPIAPRGTDFQQRVWAAMRAVPYGRTRSYGEIARELGSAPRAVGQACGRNPILLVNPCHRIVGAQGLGGFGGRDQKPDRKTFLLAHEAAHAQAIRRMTGAAADDSFSSQRKVLHRGFHA